MIIHYMVKVYMQKKKTINKTKNNILSNYN